jgi:hypothetical protein
MWLMRYAAVLLCATVLVPPTAPAQVTVVDEGSFTISRAGAPVGRESFMIRRTASPGGDILVASATVELNDHRLTPALRTDAAGAALAYQVEVKSGANVQERLSGNMGRGRFSARLRTPRGESAKEYIVADGALVLDDDVFHHYYFLATGNRNGALPIVIPRRNVQVAMRVESAGRETVKLGAASIEARHLVITEPGGSVRHVWVDADGRVLRVSIESLGVVATRDRPPR